MQMDLEEYDKSEEAQLQTTFHECGHALIAEVIGSPLKALSIVREGDRLGGFIGGNSKAKGDLYYHHMAMMSLAGMIAEEILTGRSIKSLTPGDAQWYLKVEGLKGRAFITKAYREARKHITDNWTSVTHLANELFKKKKLTREEIKQILGTCQK